MASDRIAWAKAYARQSLSDFKVFEFLSNSEGIEECHRLHFLQMACEKIAKAYRFRDTTKGSEDLLTSHVGFSTFLRIYLNSTVFQSDYRDRDALFRGVSQFSLALAREIERLAPAVDREAFPCNVEYPWEEYDTIFMPCAFTYPNLQSLKQSKGINFLKIIRKAIEEFDNLSLR